MHFPPEQVKILRAALALWRNVVVDGQPSPSAAYVASLEEQAGLQHVQGWFPPYADELLDSPPELEIPNAALQTIVDDVQLRLQGHKAAIERMFGPAEGHAPASVVLGQEDKEDHEDGA